MGKLQDILTLYKNQNTLNVYRAGLCTFFDFIYGNQKKRKQVSTVELEQYDRLATQYIEGKDRDYLDDLQRFCASMNNRPPHTARGYFKVVREFFAQNGIEFSPREIRRARNKLPKGGSRTVESDIDHEILRTLLHHMDVKGRGLTLLLAASGMRLGETLQLSLNNINLDTSPGEITVRSETTKTGVTRHTFLTGEAVQAIREWLKVRDHYIDAAQNRNNGLIKAGIGSKRSTRDDRLFPFTDQTVNQLWDTALRKSGLLSKDATTGRKQLHPHMLRKFFISQLSLVVSKEVPEVLAGHSGYLTDAYRRYSQAQLAEQYLRGENQLTIQIPRELKEIEGKFQARMENQGVILEKVVVENAELQSRIRKQEEFTQKILSEKDELKQYLDQLRELSLSFAKIIGVIQNNPDAAYALQNGVNEWRKEILEGKYGPGLRDRLIQLDAKQKTV
jgi:integrase